MINNDHTTYDHTTYSSRNTIITSTGNPIEGQSYSQTCAIMGSESLPPSTVRWNWNGDSRTLSSSPTLNFTPLTRSDGGTYTCTVTITSPLLNNTHTAINNRTLTVTRK